MARTLTPGLLALLLLPSALAAQQEGAPEIVRLSPFEEVALDLDGPRWLILVQPPGEDLVLTVDFGGGHGGYVRLALVDPREGAPRRVPAEHIVYREPGTRIAAVSRFSNLGVGSTRTYVAEVGEANCDRDGYCTGRATVEQIGGRGVEAFLETVLTTPSSRYVVGVGPDTRQKADSAFAARDFMRAADLYASLVHASPDGSEEKRDAALGRARAMSEWSMRSYRALGASRDPWVVALVSRRLLAALHYLHAYPLEDPRVEEMDDVLERALADLLERAPVPGA
jgi:hypothetical protein